MGPRNVLHSMVEGKRTEVEDWEGRDVTLNKRRFVADYLTKNVALQTSGLAAISHNKI